MATRLLSVLLCGASLVFGASRAAANVITDWDEKAVMFVKPSPSGTRVMAMVHLAMFADARIWAGFHYRFSTEVGREMGQKVGRHVVESLLQRVK